MSTVWCVRHQGVKTTFKLLQNTIKTMFTRAMKLSDRFEWPFLWSVLGVRVFGPNFIHMIKVCTSILLFTVHRYYLGLYRTDIKVVLLKGAVLQQWDYTSNKVVQLKI